MAYSVRPTSWYPPSALQDLRGSRRCCVGVSVGQPAFRGRRLTALLDWLLTNSNSVLFLVGDQILRHTIQIELGDGSDDAALTIALQRGVEQSRAIEEGIKAHMGLQAQIVPISQIVLTPEFHQHQSWVESLEQSNGAFSRSLIDVAESYLHIYKAQGRRIAVPHDAALRLCRSYLKEELAAFGVIHQWGWMIDVYPGPELPVLLEIAQGKYPDAPHFLRHRMSISLEHERIHSPGPSSSEKTHATL